jgi:hypothetical protein
MTCDFPTVSCGSSSPRTVIFAVKYLNHEFEPFERIDYERKATLVGGGGTLHIPYVLLKVQCCGQSAESDSVFSFRRVWKIPGGGRG